jgi:hypothetical protein
MMKRLGSAGEDHYVFGSNAFHLGDGLAQRRVTGRPRVIHAHIQQGFERIRPSKIQKLAQLPMRAGARRQVEFHDGRFRVFVDPLIEQEGFQIHLPLPGGNFSARMLAEVRAAMNSGLAQNYTPARAGCTGPYWQPGLLREDLNEMTGPKGAPTILNYAPPGQDTMTSSTHRPPQSIVLFQGARWRYVD